jgi:hypothetical protein
MKCTVAELVINVEFHEFELVQPVFEFAADEVGAVHV